MSAEDIAICLARGVDPNGPGAAEWLAAHKGLCLALGRDPATLPRPRRPPREIDYSRACEFIRPRILAEESARLVEVLLKTPKAIRPPPVAAEMTLVARCTRRVSSCRIVSPAFLDPQTAQV